MFEKVSFAQFLKDCRNLNITDCEEALKDAYDAIKIPVRATKGSAGYDISVPVNTTIVGHDTVVVPSGLKCSMNDDEVLLIFPRSSIGIKRGLRLSNSTGVIDASYYGNADNEGHMMIALHNYRDNDVFLDMGERVAQAVLIKYQTFGDVVDTERVGGIGSSGRI